MVGTVRTTGATFSGIRYDCVYVFYLFDLLVWRLTLWPYLAVIGHLDVSWNRPFLSQACSSCAEVQGGDYRWCKIQRPKAGLQGMKISGM